MKKRISFFGMALVTAAFLGLAPVQAQSGNKDDNRVLTKSIAVNGAKSVKAHLDMAAGTLTVRGKTDQLVNATFVYTKDEYKPEISSATTGTTGTWSIKQPQKNNQTMHDEDRNDWTLDLNTKIPTDLYVKMGAGKGEMDFKGMKLSKLKMEVGAGDFSVNLANTSIPSLEINAGVGALSVDLTGKWTNALQADIKGGIGDVTLKLPKQTGVRVKVNGLGSVEESGFHKDGDYYVNNAYKKGGSNLEVTVNGGLGSVNLQIAD